MSDSITDRIAAITRRHREELHEEDVCICGYHGNWATHVAEVIVDQLGLTQEWVAQADAGTDFIRFEYADILDVIERSPSAHVSTRYVTKWAAG